VSRRKTCSSQPRPLGVLYGLARRVIQSRDQITSTACAQLDNTTDLPMPQQVNLGVGRMDAGSELARREETQRETHVEPVPKLLACDEVIGCAVLELYGCRSL
jgi:hypothetical protein